MNSCSTHRFGPHLFLKTARNALGAADAKIGEKTTDMEEEEEEADRAAALGPVRLIKTFSS